LLLTVASLGIAAVRRGDSRRPVRTPNYQDTLKKSEISRRHWIGGAAHGLRYRSADDLIVSFRHRRGLVSKALIPITPSCCETSARQARRPQADFVAHLIAVRLQAPQTRARRCVEPEHAAAAYGALGQWPTPAGRVLSRAL
jgi:hypothetical protein